MVMINRIYLTVMVKGQRWSGTNDILNLTIHSKTGRLLDNDFNFAGQEIPDGGGRLFERQIPSDETFDSADIDVMTLGIRGGNLARISGVVIWGGDGTTHVPLYAFLALDPVAGVATDAIILSADVLEGSLIHLMRPMPLAAPNDRFSSVIAVVEPRSGFLTTAGGDPSETIRDPADSLLQLTIKAMDGHSILSEPLSNSNTLPDKEAYVWFFNDFAPFTVAEAVNYDLKLIPHGETQENLGLSKTMIIGITSSGAARCLATTIGRRMLEKL